MLKTRFKATTAIIVGLSLATPVPAYGFSLSGGVVLAQANQEQVLPPEAKPDAPPPDADPAVPAEAEAQIDTQAESLHEATPEAATPEEVQEAVDEAPANTAPPAEAADSAAPVTPPAEPAPETAQDEPGAAEAQAEAEAEVPTPEAIEEAEEPEIPAAPRPPETAQDTEVTPETATEAETATETEIRTESETTAEETPAQPDADTAEDTAAEPAEAETAAEDETPAQSEEVTAEEPAAEAEAEATVEETTQPEAETPAAQSAEEEPDTEPAEAVAETPAPEPELEALEGEAPVEVQRSTVTEAEASTATRERAEDDGDDDDDNRLRNLLGAAAAGVVVGALLPRSDTRVVNDLGDRVILERNGRYHVRRDENALLYRPGVDVVTEEYPNGYTRTIVTRQNGVQVVTVRDEAGFIIRRSRITPDGTRYVLYAAEPYYERDYVNYDEVLPPLAITIPRSQYIVDYQDADRKVIREALLAPPVDDVTETYSIQDVRESERLRDYMPRIDLTAITFKTGSSAIQPSQLEALNELGRSMASVIDENPREVFLIEGHTDAVGAEMANLALSDRRAESVALALTENYDIPPENLVVQGYGEEYLKVQTQGPERANRRVAVRRITPLVTTQAD